jgi:serine/threonine-protein kinase
MTAKYNIQLQDSLFDRSFEILAPVGRGRNSVVYKARDIRDAESKTLALKVLVAGLKDPSIICSQARAEAAAMRACENRNVTRLYDYVATSDLCYLVLDYAAGGDLGRYLSTQGEPLPLRLAMPVMDQVLCGLQAVHAAGYLHRDIKPENILITAQGEAKISDFGIAVEKARLAEIADANRGVGTFEYLAPESLNDGVCDEHTDMYAAAVSFYQILSAIVPFSGNSFSQQVNHKLNADLVPLSYLVPGISKSLSSVILKALKPRRQDRFESIECFRLALLESIRTPRSVSAHQLEAFEGVSDLDDYSTSAGVVEGTASSENEAEMDGELSEETLLDAAGYRVLSHTSSDELATVETRAAGLTIVPQKSRRARVLRDTSLVLVLFVSIGIFSILSSSWSLDSAKAFVGSFISKTSSFGLGETPIVPEVVQMPSSNKGVSKADVSLVKESEGSLGFASLAKGPRQGVVGAYRGAEKTYRIFTYPLPEKEILIVEVAGPGSPVLEIPFADLANSKVLTLKGDRVELELQLHRRGNSAPGLVFGKFVEKFTNAQGAWSIDLK